MPTIHSEKLLGLEALRFCSAVAVLIWHYQHFAFVAYTPTNFLVTQQPFYSVFGWFYDYGFYGVQVFWCISGFIFFWKYGIPIHNNIVGAKQFFILRVSRLYPLHITTLLFVAGLQLVYFHLNHFYFLNPTNDFFHFLLQLFFGSDWGFERGLSFNGPIWSISVEVLVYAVFYGTVRFIGTSPVVNLGILVLCVLAKKIHIDSPVIECLAFFYSGGLSALALQHFEKTKYHKFLKTITVGIAVFVPIVVSVFHIYAPKYVVHFALVAYIPTLLYCVASDLHASPKVQQAIATAGSVTYSSYLIHFPLQLVIATLFSYLGQPIPFYSSGLFIAYIGITLCSSVAIYRHFEMPAQAYIRRRLHAPQAMRVGWVPPNWVRLR